MFVVRKCSAIRACWMLLLATVFWGASFVLMKALGQTQQKLLPEANSWFFSSLSLLVRFAVGTLVLLAWNLRSLRQITRLELWQGAGLGVFGGFGIVFQMDGVLHTSASTSAFLTQCYCVLIPVWVALRQRQWPKKIIALSCVMVLVGVAVLSEFNWRELKLGRGEWESALASVFFTGQILWLERPVFSANKSGHTTLTMFAIIALIALPVVLFSAASPRDLWAAYQSPAAISFVALLTAACTLGAYGLMNYWQPHISATCAGLIYCSEPLFTALFALCLPGYFSGLAQINYLNEKLTSPLLVGGGFILVANILILAEAARLKTEPVQLAPETAESLMPTVKQPAVN